MSRAARRERYAELIATQPNALVFQQPWWLDVVSPGWGAIFFGGNALPVYQQSKLGLKLIRMPLLTPYWFSEKQDPTALGHAFSLLPKCAQMQLNAAPGIAPIAVQNNWKITECTTYLLNLENQTKESLFENFHPKLRNKMRKAERNLTVHNTPLSAAQYIAWSLGSYDYFPYKAYFLDKLWSAAAQNRASISLVAKNDTGRDVAMLWAVFDNRNMYLLQSAFDKDAKAPGAVGLLIYNAMQLALDMRLAIFDFEGSSIPSIADFFERFGGQRHSYYSYWHTQSALWRLKQQIFS